MEKRRRGDEDGEQSKGRKKMRIDRLSALPDALLINILHFLDEDTTLDVAKTSVLSKTWRSLWADLPELRFHEESKELDKITKFVSRVDTTLATRTAKSLEQFQVNFFYSRAFASNADAWVEFALRSKVKRFWRQTNVDCRELYRPPEMLYSNSWLEQLWLLNCRVGPKTRVEWKSLTTLNLGSIHLRQSVVENILSGCPVLYSLELIACWGFKSLNLTSPNLTHLQIHDYFERSNHLDISAPYMQSLMNPKEAKLKLTNIRPLREASLDILAGDGWDPKLASADEMNDVKDVFQATLHVPKLVLGFSLFEFISLMVTDGWELPQSMRAYLKVYTCYNDEDNNIYGIIKLLESCPNLEELQVYGRYLGEEVLPWRPPPPMDDLNCDLLHLKTVTMLYFEEGGDPLQTLFHILMKRAKSLGGIYVAPDTWRDETSDEDSDGDIQTTS